MNRKPNVYILDYYIKRGPLDDSIGAKRNMLIVGFSVEDVKRTFLKSNRNAQLVNIDSDSRQIGLSIEFLEDLLQHFAPKYMKYLRSKEVLLDEAVNNGKQYNSNIVNEDYNLTEGI